MDKGLVIAYGLPGVGKTTLMGEIGRVSSERGFNFCLYNSGELRRTDPKYSWLKSAEDFASNPSVLDDISETTFGKVTRALASPDARVILGFDQTYTRESSRRRIWPILSTLREVPYIISEIHTSEDPAELIEALRRKTQNGDYTGAEANDAVNDFIRRHTIYRRSATHYSDDEFFKSRRPAFVRIDRATGKIEVGNEKNTSPELVEIVVDSMKKVVGNFNHKERVASI